MHPEPQIFTRPLKQGANVEYPAESRAIQLEKTSSISHDQGLCGRQSAARLRCYNRQLILLVSF